MKKPIKRIRQTIKKQIILEYPELDDALKTATTSVDITTVVQFWTIMTKTISTQV